MQSKYNTQNMYDNTCREKAQDPRIRGSQAIFENAITQHHHHLEQTEGMPRRHDGASNPPGAQALRHLVNIHVYDL